jgi:hypothetical protein
MDKNKKNDKLNVRQKLELIEKLESVVSVARVCEELRRNEMCQMFAK